MTLSLSEGGGGWRKAFKSYANQFRISLPKSVPSAVTNFLSDLNILKALQINKTQK
jgi:chitinase